MIKVIFTKGIIASGKTTWAKQFVKDNQKYKRVSRDDLRHMLSSYTFTNDNENIVTQVERDTIKQLLLMGYNLVIDKQNLNQQDFANDKRFILDLVDWEDTVEFEVKEFPITLYQAILRDKEREFQIGEAVITKTWKRYEKDLLDMLERAETATYPFDPALPGCVVCDIDGTLAIRGDRSPFDFSKVGEDKLNKPVAQLLDKLSIGRNLGMGKEGPYIIIFSGRDDSCMEETINWLKKYNVFFDELYMRKTGDKRKDSIVKRELFDNYVAGKYNCMYWVDDRRQVIDMVRNDLRITCLDVAGHDF